MSKFLYKIEEAVAMFLFALTVLMVLVGAVGRTAGVPQTWSIDLAQAIFAWCCVLGADIALKNRGHIIIDIAVRPMPAALQTFLSYLWYIIIRGDGIIPEPGAGIRPENCGKRREIAGNRGMGTPI